MSVKYHVNTDTGKVGVCHAQIKCDFIEALHADSKEEAMLAYENIMCSSRIPILKKPKKYSPKPIKNIEELSYGKTVKKESSYDNIVNEELWVQHNGENIGYVKLMTKRVFWREENQEMPKDHNGNKTDHYTILCDIETRTPGIGQASFILEKIMKERGDIYVTGSVTPEGFTFISKHKDQLKQEYTDYQPDYNNIKSSGFSSTHNSMSFVRDWDNATAKYPL